MPRAAQILVVERKPQRFDQVQVGVRREAEPGDVAGVGRDLGFDEDDVDTPAAGHGSLFIRKVKLKAKRNYTI